MSFVCEGLSPTMGSEAAFASMYGAVLRRVGKLKEAQPSSRMHLIFTHLITFKK